MNFPKSGFKDNFTNSDKKESNSVDDFMNYFRENDDTSVIQN